MKLQLTKLEKFVVESPDTFEMIATQLNRSLGAVIRAYGRGRRKILLQEKNGEKIP
jgi:hypothetical protein